MVTMVVYGDSISADTYTTDKIYPSGWYKYMVAGAMSYTLLGNGVSSVSGVKMEPDNAFLTRVAPFAPDVLIVNLGTNNFYAMGTTDDMNTWRAAHTTLWTQIRALPKQPRAYVIGLLPTLTGSGWIYSYNDEWLRAEMDTVTRDTCLINGGVYVSMAGFHAGMTRKDGHPNIYGHGHIAGLVLRGMGLD